MKVLLVATAGYGFRGKWYLRGLIAAGCDVIVVNKSRFFPFTRSIVRRIANRFTKQNRQKAYNEIIAETALHSKPDLILVIKGNHVFPETLREIKDGLKGLTIFNLNNDDFFSMYKSNATKALHDSISLYDCLFASRQINIKELLSAGAKRVEYLPFCYDPFVHFPITPSVDDYRRYKSDISFIGTFEKQRADFMECLSVYDFSIWGNGWYRKPESLPLINNIRNQDVYELEFAKVVNSSKIILNFFRKGERGVFDSRALELPACRGFVLSERTDELLKYFEEDKEVVCFGSPEELKEKVDYYLGKDKEREKIAVAGYQKLKKLNCTVYDRMREILRVYQAI